MFRPSAMDRVELLVLKSDLAAVSRALARAGILHLRPVVRAGLHRPGTGELAPATDRIKAFAERLDGLLQTLGLEEGRAEGAPLEIDLPVWEAWAAELAEQTGRIVQREQEISRRQERLDHLEALVLPLAGLEGDFADIAALRHGRLLWGTLPSAGEKKLVEMTVPGAVFPLRHGAREVSILVLTTRREAADVESLLAELDFKPAFFPGGLSGPFEAVLQKVRRVRSRTAGYAATLGARVAGLREEHRKHLLDRRRAVSAELFLRQAEASFGFSRRAVLLGGWLPRRRVWELEALLKKVCPGRFALRRAAAHGDDTPVELTNPLPLRPFQKILKIFGTPLYGELEPTPLLALGFLLLFGMMFGDVGQGLVLVGAGWGLRRFTRFGEEGLLVAEVGASATLFGLLFGSVFGAENLLPALWFSPLQNIPLLMLSALAIGVVLIFSGLLLRVRNMWRQEPLKVLLTDRFGLGGAVFYGGAILTAALVALDLAPMISLLWLAVPLGCVFFHPLVAADEGERSLPLLLAEGVIEVMETVLGYLVNTFSFLRVGAFGLAHIGLSLAVFALADLVRGLPFGGLWAVLIYLVGNGIILALEGLVVSIQALRLQFYEFFTKFFRGGGIPYRPLALELAAERRA
jgi:V/A-type H+-transporting ATPase subunit I